MSGLAGRRIPVLLLAAACAPAAAQREEVCVARVEAATASAGSASATPELLRSHLGIRPRRQQLFDFELAVSLPGGTQCAISGVARVRGAPGQEVLAFPIRPEAGAPRRPVRVPCQIIVQRTSTALIVTTTEEACQADPPCGGVVPLHGQRFELASTVPAGVQGPCFARAGP
jgi:hypothetical protein